MSERAGVARGARDAQAQARPALGHDRHCVVKGPTNRGEHGRVGGVAREIRSQMVARPGIWRLHFARTAHADERRKLGELLEDRGAHAGGSDQGVIENDDRGAVRVEGSGAGKGRHLTNLDVPLATTEGERRDRSAGRGDQEWAQFGGESVNEEFRQPAAGAPEKMNPLALPPAGSNMMRDRSVARLR